jgi:hypothetical protein
MKITLIFCVLATSGFAREVIRAPITPAALAKLQQTAPVSQLETPAPGEAVVSRPDKQSIIKESIILSDGSNWTLVPKGAIICLPEAMKSRVITKPIGNLLSWIEFQTKNRAWVTTTEVTFDQAAGHKPLPSNLTAFFAKQDKIVIAVHQNGPISMRVPNEAKNITKR